MIVKLVLYVGIVSACLNAGAVTAANMYPDTAKNSFTDRPPESINSKTETYQEIRYTEHGKEESIKSPSTVETTYEGKYGKKEVSRQIDYTNALDLDKLYSDRSKENITKASALMGDMRKKAANKFKDKEGTPIDPTRPETFSKDAIIKNFEEESDTRSALAFQKELYNQMRAKLVTDGQIQCYITRKINNSFFCPLPDHGTADFGGGGKDSQEEAQARCDRECRVPTECMEHITGDASVFAEQGEATLPIDEQVYHLNPEQRTKEFAFSYEINNTNDIQDKYFEDGLVRGRITIIGIDPSDNEVTLYSGYVYRIEKEGGRVSLSINKRLKEMRVHFFDSFIFDPRYMDEVALYGDNPEVTIKDISAGYDSNKRYFCPLTQFVADSQQCDGEIKFVSFGGATHSVCVPREDILPSTRSSIDGGYYTKETCLAACWEEAKCIPTYRHLSLDPNALSSDMYDLEYGCVDSDNNQGCTKERCRQMFEGDIQPSKEIVWEKDDKKIVTVDSGVEVSGKIRPRVDFQGELGAIGSDDRQNLFNEEMKDYAYRKMVEEESFNVTKKRVEEDIPEKWAADVRVNSAARQISFTLLYKAKASLYDSGRELHLYPVIEMFVVYRPYKAIYYNGWTYYPDRDTRMRALDSVLLIQDQATGAWIPFRRKMWQKYYLPTEQPNGEIVYRWLEATANLRVKQDIFQDGKYVAFGPGYSTPNMGIHFSPISDKPWEEYRLFMSLDNLVNLEGVLITNNTARTGKLYTYSDLNPERKGAYYGYRVYAVSSEVPLDLAGVASRVGERTLVYDSRNVSTAKTEIEPDSQYADDRVKLYSLGSKEKKSVFVKIKPNSTEIEQKGILFMFLHE